MTNTIPLEQPLVWPTPRGRVSLLPSRGRILQIEADGQPCLWNPPEVTALWNLGGERLWIRPEPSWFWKQTAGGDAERPGRWCAGKSHSGDRHHWGWTRGRCGVPLGADRRGKEFEATPRFPTTAKPSSAKTSLEGALFVPPNECSIENRAPRCVSQMKE